MFASRQDWRVGNVYAVGDEESIQSNLNPSESNRFKVPTAPNYKILIVEDERLIAENLRYILEEDKYQVVGIASSGIEALQLVEQSQPELILMDIRIQGDLDGVHVAKLIQDHYSQKIPVLFLSAHSQDQFPHLLQLDSNSYDYLKKPYSPEDVLEAIKMLQQKVTDHSSNV